MKYLLSFIFFACLISCHQGESTSTKVEHKQVAEDNTIDKNMIMTPEEMSEDSVFADGSKPAAWSVSGINDQTQLKIFIKLLRLWVEQGNKDSIAAHIQYPLRNNKSVTTSSDFLKNYDVLFDAKVIKALKDQKLSQIFRNKQGAMIGNGELWIRNVSSGNTEEFKIISINN